MVTIDVPMCMTLGSAMALKHAAELPTRTAELRTRTLALTLFGFTPLAHMFELYFRDWEWQYVSPNLPLFFSMLFIVAMNALGLLTFEWTRSLLLAGKHKQARAVLFGTLAFTNLYILVFFRRVLWVGTYAEWQSGQAPFMPTRVDFMSVLIGASAWLGVGVYLWLLRPLSARASNEAKQHAT